jgi:nucleoid-associated protein YgaU
MSRARAAAGPALWAAALTAAAAGLYWSGRGSLAPPPLGDPGRWRAWLEARDPVVAAFSVLRLGALATVSYVVAVVALGLVVRAVGAGRLVLFTDRLTIAPVRRMLAGLSLSLAATTVATVAVPATMLPAAVAQPAPSSTTTTTVGPATTAATVTMHLLTPADLSPAPAPPAAAAVPARSPVATAWTVRPGECFWTIAESVLTQAWGRPPTDAEIVPYWQRLIAANAAALVHPGNPDLIFPGQIFQVPAL